MSCHVAVPKVASVCALRSNRWQALTPRTEFLTLQSKAKKWVTPSFVIYADRLPQQIPAVIGITVTKKLGGSCVRNRIKRRLRAVFDGVTKQYDFSGYRIIVIARADAQSTEIESMQRNLLWALRRLEMPVTEVVNAQ